MGYKTDAAGNQIFGEKELQLGQARFLRTDDGSAPMNVNGAPAGTPETIYNGSGDTPTDWTNSIGTTGSETAGAARGGSAHGWDTGQISGGGDWTGWDTSPSFDVAAAYDSVSFWFNPQEKEAGTNLLVRWYESGGAKGSSINVEDYVANFDIGVWQKVTVPIADFGLPASQLVDQLRFNYTATGPKKQHYYYDDIELNPTGAGGGPYIFEVAAPDANTLYHITMVNLMVVGPKASWEENTFGSVAALSNGVLFRHQDIITPQTIISLNSKDNIDLFGRYHPQEVVDYTTNRQVGFMLKPGRRAAITVTNQKVLQFMVRDDVSGLANMRAFAHFGIEDIS